MKATETLQDPGVQKAFTDEMAKEALRFSAADILGVDMRDSGEDIAYLVDYAHDRAGIQTAEQLQGWLVEMQMRAAQTLGHQTSGSRTRDMVTYLRLGEHFARDGRQGTGSRFFAPAGALFQRRSAPGL